MMDPHVRAEQVKEYMDVVWPNRRDIKPIVKVLESGCIKWLRSKSTSGYPLLTRRVDDKPITLLVTRIIACGFFDEIDDYNFDALVCHTCDYPSCINPDHFFFGDYHDNTIDSIEKGRNYNSNLTHCLRGHEFTPENTQTRIRNSRIGRQCKECYKKLRGE